MIDLLSILWLIIFFEWFIRNYPELGTISLVCFILGMVYMFYEDIRKAEVQESYREMVKKINERECKETKDEINKIIKGERK